MPADSAQGDSFTTPLSPNISVKVTRIAPNTYSYVFTTQSVIMTEAETSIAAPKAVLKDVVVGNAAIKDGSYVEQVSMGEQDVTFFTGAVVDNGSTYNSTKQQIGVFPNS